MRNDALLASFRAAKENLNRDKTKTPQDLQQAAPLILAGLIVKHLPITVDRDVAPSFFIAANVRPHVIDAVSVIDKVEPFLNPMEAVDTVLQIYQVRLSIATGVFDGNEFEGLMESKMVPEKYRDMFDDSVEDVVKVAASNPINFFQGK